VASADRLPASLLPGRDEPFEEENERGEYEHGKQSVVDPGHPRQEEVDIGGRPGVQELLEYRRSHVFSIIIWVAARRVRLAEPGPAAFSLKRGFGSTLPRCGRVGQGETRSCSRAKPQRRVYHHNVTPTPTERHIGLLSSACAGRS
jgi:hypothetical protein